MNEGTAQTTSTQSSTSSNSSLTAAFPSTSIVSSVAIKESKVDVVISKILNADQVPAALIETVRQYQLRMMGKGVAQSIELKNSNVKQCIIHLANTSSKQEKKLTEINDLETYLKLHPPADTPDSANSGLIDWHFEGINKFESITIYIKDRTWEVEFSRLIRPQNSALLHQAKLKTKAHQEIFEQLIAALKPVEKSLARNVVVLQGGSGLGKTHCAQHYFYHLPAKQYQMVAWLSGTSEKAFISDWQILAHQLRNLRSALTDMSDDDVIRDWCENQLGQWLFIIDEVNIEADWLNKYLPKCGGSVVLTTHRPNFQLQSNQITLAFSPLSSEDSKVVLQTYLGNHWKPTGLPQEEKALSYLVKALGGYSSALTQMGLLVQKKCLSFEGLVNQLKEPKIRPYLLKDTIYDQLKNQTFITAVQKGWRQLLEYFNKLYPQLRPEQHEEHLKQFVDLLSQQVGTISKETSEFFINNDDIEEYWLAVASSLSVSLNIDELRTWLHCLPLLYDRTNQKWHLSLIGLSALQLQCSPTLFPTISLVTAMESEPNTEPYKAMEYLKLPSGVDFLFRFNNSILESAQLSVLTLDKLNDFKVWRLPTENPHFIPRSDVTNKLIERLPIKKTGEKSHQMILAAATGMGGIGKTELARHYITNPELSGHYQRRFWLTATNVSEIRSEFYRLAVYLGFVEAKKYIKDEELKFYIHRWLSIHSGWLMVIDNADNYNEIADWVPKEGGTVLITTRIPSPGTLSNEQIIQVPLLNPEEALSWLWQLSGRDKNNLTMQEKDAAKQLVDKLGYLPLAIAQAAAYLRTQTTVSISVYLNNFVTLLSDGTLAKQEDTHTQRVETDPDSQSRRVITSTWKLSLKAIESYTKSRGIPNLAEVLLSYCSFLAPKDIPLPLLVIILEKNQQIDFTLINYWLDEYIGQLLQYSILERNLKDNTDFEQKITINLVSMHALVQTVIREELKQTKARLWESRIQEVFKGFCYLNAVNNAVLNNGGDELAYTETLEKATLVHALGFDKYVTQAKPALALINTSDWADFLGELGNTQFRLGINKEAMNYMERSLKIQILCYGENNYLVAKSLANLGRIYGSLGNDKKSEVLLKRALPILERHYEKDHYELARTLVNLGNTCGALGHINEMKIHLERALAIQEKHHGKGHYETAQTLMGLSNYYGDIGDNLSKKLLLERTLAIQEKHYGKGHYQTTGTLNNLGNACGALGHINEKISRLEEALAIQESYYGKNHSETARTLMNLGSAYRELRNAIKAKSLLEKALAIQKTYYGENHPEVALTLQNLSVFYLELEENFDLAAKFNNKAYTIFLSHYGPYHPYTLITKKNSEIIPLQKQQSASSLSSMPSNQSSPSSLQEVKRIYNEAMKFYRSNDFTNALELWIKALEIAESIPKKDYPNYHNELSILYANIGTAHKNLDHREEAINYLKKSIATREEKYGMNCKEAQKSRDKLAELENLFSSYPQLNSVSKGDNVMSHAKDQNLPTTSNIPAAAVVSAAGSEGTSATSLNPTRLSSTATVRGNDDIITDRFFMNLADQYNAKALKQNIKIGFIVVCHMVPTLKYYLSALEHFGHIVCLIPKGFGAESNRDPRVFAEASSNYPMMADVTRKTLSSENTINDFLVNRLKYNTEINKDVKYVIIDEGGYFTNHPLPDAFNQRLIGIIETTENGHQRYAEKINQIKVPVYSIARTPLKAVEDAFVGKSIVYATEAELRVGTNTMIERFQKVGVMGFGKIGKSTASTLLNNIQVKPIIFEPNPSRAIEAGQYQVAENKNKVGNGMPPIYDLSEYNLLFCTTGRGSLRGDIFKSLKDNVFIASCTSCEDEFRLDWLNDPANADVSRQGNFTVYTLKDSGKRINFVNHGNSANFLYNAVEGPSIYLVFACTILSIINLINRSGQPNLIGKINELSDNEQDNLAKRWLVHYAAPAAPVSSSSVSAAPIVPDRANPLQLIERKLEEKLENLVSRVQTMPSHPAIDATQYKIVMPIDVKGPTTDAPIGHEFSNLKNVPDNRAKEALEHQQKIAAAGIYAPISVQTDTPVPRVGHEMLNIDFSEPATKHKKDKHNKDKHNKDKHHKDKREKDRHEKDKHHKKSKKEKGAEPLPSKLSSSSAFYKPADSTTANSTTAASSTLSSAAATSNSGETPSSHRPQ
jgi:S-adenosylhomocysteine hydrolase